MGRPTRLAGVAFALFRVAHLAGPSTIYQFSLDSVRRIRSDSSEPSDSTRWTYRFIGSCLVVVGASYLI